jgi:hypothetical protein
LLFLLQLEIRVPFRDVTQAGRVPVMLAQLSVVMVLLLLLLVLLVG